LVIVPCTPKSSNQNILYIRYSVIASSFENIPQIVLVECNPVFDEERDLHVNKLTKKFLKVPENR
jgi:hypothetical protein